MGLVVKTLILIGLSTGYLFITIRGIILVYKSIVLTRTQQLVHSFLIIALPFFWFYILKDILTSETPVVTKEVREKRKKKNYWQYYEGGIHG